MEGNLSSQINFLGDANCPVFTPNPFRKNFCTACQSRIQHHSVATDEQIKAAIEYAVDKGTPLLLMFVSSLLMIFLSKVPSRVWSTEANTSLYVGGFKAALNLEFLESNKIGCIVHAAHGLEHQFGSKVQALFRNRRKNMPYIQEMMVAWNDSMDQRIDPQYLEGLLNAISESISDKSVLIHCAQGKSRSVLIAVAFIARTEGISVRNALLKVQEQRKMAQPNPNFMNQLFSLEKAGYFSRIKTTGFS